MMPIWYLISDEERLGLMAYQWKYYKTKLTIPVFPEEGMIKPVEEIGKILRQAPSRSRGKV